MDKHIPIARLMFLLSAFLPAWSLPSDSSGISDKQSAPSLQIPVPGMGSEGAGPLKDFHDAYSQAMLFIDAADEKNVKVSPEEVSARMAAYAVLYPGQDIGPKRVQDLLKVEKYLAAQGKDVSDRDVDSRLSDLNANGIAIKDGNREALRQALKTEFLLKRDDVRQLGEKTLDLATLRNQEIMENSRQQWPLESLRLQGDPNECLASMDGDCWATLEEYNAAIGEIRMPRAVPLDTAKAETLRAYLSEKHTAKSEPALGSGRLADSIIESMKAQKSGMEWRRRTLGMGRQVVDQKSLWETYDRYYRELFRARMEAAVEVVGSSDSIHIDSLYQALTRWKQDAVASRKAGRAPPEEPSMPWLAFKEEELPRILSAHTDTLQPGEFTHPVKTNIGFFLARVRDTRQIKEVSFQAALPHLIFLATRDKFLRMDSVLEAKSRKYYRMHKDEFRIPDTLELTAWLVPFRLQGNGKARQYQYLLSPNPGKDTSHFAPLKISSLWLTQPLQNQIRDLARNTSPLGRQASHKPFFGPLKGEYGQWYFRIEKTRKAGGFQSYAAVKPEIIRRLTSPEIELDTLASDSSKKEVLLTLGRAKFNERRENSEWESLPDGEILRLIQTGEMDTTGFPKGLEKEQLIAIAKRKWIDQNQIQRVNGKYAFLKEVEIDYARLFKP